MLFYALPFISGDLRPSGTQQLWIIDTYGFMLAGMLITMGAVGDWIGRRRLLLIGALVFGLASLAASYAIRAEGLILARGALGLAGATLMPSTLALIRNMFHDPDQRKVGIAVWTGALAMGVSLGPLIGGVLLNYFWWGSVFLINLPVMALLLLIGPFLLPEYRAPQQGRFDVLGAVLAIGAVLATTYGVKKLAIEGCSVVPAAALVGGLVFGVLFIHRQRTYASPLIEIRLFRDPTFSTAILIKSVTLFALAGISLFAHQFVQLVLGLRPLTAALWSFTVFPAIMIAVQVTGALATRVKPVNIIATGLFIMLGGFAVLAGMLDVDSPLWIVLIGAGAAATGMVMTSVVNNNMVLSAAPPERAGSASALSQTGDELGAALGLALLGTVGTAIYHRQMAATTIEGLPPAAQEVARDTLGGATAVAAQLPGELSSALLETSRVAFTHGMNWAAVLGGSVLAMTALIAMVTLRTRTTPPHANNGQHPRPRVIVVTLHAAPTRPVRQPTLCSTAGFC